MRRRFANLRWLHKLRRPDRLLWRRLLARHQPAQDLVEYALIVAAVAFVGILGANAISRAEQTVFTNGPLVAPTPVKDFFLHRTSMTASCDPPPVPQSTFIVGDTVQCHVTVTDVDSNPTAPNGTIALSLGSAANPVIESCSPLTPVAAGSVTATCQSPLSGYTWKDADVGTRTIYAAYTPTPLGVGTDHQSISVPAATFDVVVKLKFVFSVCTNPWSAAPSNALLPATNAALLGQPLVCQLQVQNLADSSPYAGQDVSLTARTGVGYAWFSCFTNDGSNPNSFALINDNACTPQHDWTCTTDDNGYCAGPVLPTTPPAPGQTSFLYRRTFDYSGTPMTGPFNDQLTATALGQTGASQNLLIDTPSLHQTGVSVNCDNSVSHYDVTGNVRNPPPYTIQSAQNLTFSTGFPNNNVTCEASVLDLDPNTVFDHAPGPGCGSFAIPLCDIDAVDTHTPLGCVLFEVKETTPADLSVSHAFAAGTTPTCPGLPPGSNPNNWPACALGPTHSSSIPSLVPPNAYPPPALPMQPYGRLNGQLAFVSYCNVPFTVPKNARWTVQTFYQGGPAHWPSGHPGAIDSFPGPNLTVVAD